VSVPGLTITEAAAQHVGSQLAARGKGLGIRVGVKTSGCSGMAYVLEFVDYGVKVFIDPKSLVYLDGTELDFVKDGLNEGLQFRNPNVAGECGCGESFTV
jgi:iron-sulfur cluster assembly protein